MSICHPITEEELALFLCDTRTLQVPKSEVPYPELNERAAEEKRQKEAEDTARKAAEAVKTATEVTSEVDSESKPEVKEMTTLNSRMKVEKLHPIEESSSKEECKD
ncbi:hypothetical protein M422DRAFT_253305 [Sphaerobolus stellatus SS14]|uniref:Uncharacterized protein n=1 Tax=Sphaerobolus stellatus (strain SS14) TaxID=990650 RepID=A0A0C9VYA6_SPHS4|nr:hypothetical protein M422DRAFT_253305 [Sphaerobolus stellatus SS14]